MTELVECEINGGTWIVGTLTIDRFKYFTMAPAEDGTYNVVLNHDGWEYFYDGLVPEYDFYLGILLSSIKFNLTKDNIFTKRKV